VQLAILISPTHCHVLRKSSTLIKTGHWRMGKELSKERGEHQDSFLRWELFRMAQYPLLTLLLGRFWVSKLPAHQSSEVVCNLWSCSNFQQLGQLLALHGAIEWSWCNLRVNKKRDRCDINMNKAKDEMLTSTRYFQPKQCWILYDSAFERNELYFAMVDRTSSSKRTTRRERLLEGILSKKSRCMISFLLQ